MANPEHVEVAKRGARAVASWRRKNRDESFDLSGARLLGLNLDGADLRDADCEGAMFGGSSLRRAKFNFANLALAGMGGTDLRGADFEGVDARLASFKEADLRKSKNLSEVETRVTSFSRANLSGLDLSTAPFGGCDFHGANLEGVDFSEADLGGANLKSVNLSGAKLERAELDEADLSGANLERAILRSATLVGTIFRRTQLSQADFTNATCHGTQFSDVDLSSALGLAKVVHDGPSSIGIDSLYESRALIPAEFLEGCGVLTTELKELLNKYDPVQFHSCFISYSDKDKQFATRLHSRMRKERLRVWFAPEDIQAGKKIHEQIDQAIKRYDKLLLVLSENSMHSEWVKTEIYHARQREQAEGKKVLFPIRLVPYETIKSWKAFDADIGKDMAREIREYFIPDFSKWKERKSFETTFQKLLRDLATES